MYDARMLKALKRLLSRKTDALTPEDIREAARETGLVVRDAAYYGAGPAMRLYLNRGEDRYQRNEAGQITFPIEGWHRDPAPCPDAFTGRHGVIQRAIRRQGWI